MYSEAEYMALKALKHRSLLEESRWQTVREERRRVLNNAAKRNKRTGYTEEQKISERERNREQRAKLTEEEAAAATRKKGQGCGGQSSEDAHSRGLGDQRGHLQEIRSHR